MKSLQVLSDAELWADLWAAWRTYTTGSAWQPVVAPVIGTAPAPRRSRAALLEQARRYALGLSGGVAYGATWRRRGARGRGDAGVGDGARATAEALVRFAGDPELTAATWIGAFLRRVSRGDHGDGLWDDSRFTDLIDLARVASNLANERIGGEVWSSAVRRPLPPGAPEVPEYERRLGTLEGVVELAADAAAHCIAEWEVVRVAGAAEEMEQVRSTSLAIQAAMHRRMFAPRPSRRATMPPRRWPRSGFSAAASQGILDSLELQESRYEAYWEAAQTVAADSRRVVGGRGLEAVHLVEMRWSGLFGRQFLVVWVDDEQFSAAHGPQVEAIMVICDMPSGGGFPVIYGRSSRRNADSVGYNPTLEHEMVHVVQVLAGRMDEASRGPPRDIDGLLRLYWHRVHVELEASWLSSGRWPEETRAMVGVVGGTNLPRRAVFEAQADGLRNLIFSAVHGSIPAAPKRLPELLESLPGAEEVELSGIGLAPSVWRWAHARWAMSVLGVFARVTQASTPLHGPCQQAIVRWLLTFPEVRRLWPKVVRWFEQRGDLPRLGLPAARRRWPTLTQAATSRRR